MQHTLQDAIEMLVLVLSGLHKFELMLCQVSDLCHLECMQMWQKWLGMLTRIGYDAALDSSSCEGCSCCTGSTCGSMVGQHTASNASSANNIVRTV
jgi:hypothetical protein